jgi:molecular chaperone GrpE
MADTDGSSKTDTRASDAPADGAPPTENDLIARVAALEAELAAARAEAQQANDRWVRERADLENIKRRAAREKQDAVRFGTESLVRELLPVLDNLERAVEHAQRGGDGKPLVEGVELVRKTLHDLLERHGVRRVPARGERFDPTHHEAVAHVESSEHPQGAVIEEHQAGYTLHDRLLRPALVSVSKGTPPGGNLAPQGGGD